MKKSAVYTKTGDSGTTGLVGGQRIEKSNIRIDCYGTVDELNSFIGLLMAESLPETTNTFLLWVQHKLFTIGSYLATDPTNKEFLQYSQLSPESIEKIEHKIDVLDNTLPRLKSFILPGGGRSASLAHVCRTICRRVERKLYILRKTAEVDSTVLVFINRLSDFFFILSRVETFRVGKEEICWDKEIDAMK